MKLENHQNDDLGSSTIKMHRYCLPLQFYLFICLLFSGYNFSMFCLSNRNSQNDILKDLFLSKQ